MLKAVLLQLVATLLGTAIAAVFFGVRGAASAAIGGSACVLPTWLFALRLSLLSKRDGAASVSALVVGEFFKLASIVGLLALALFAWQEIHWGGLLIGLVLALKANLFAFLVKN